MHSPYIYYVYAYVREDGTPYYIGKGKNKRAFNYHGKRIAVPKDKSRIIFLETCLSEIGAYALERRYIRWYGRQDQGTGILRNKTEGGEGGPNNKGIKFTAEHKANIAATKIGKPRPQHVRDILRKANVGRARIQSEEERRKRSIARMGHKLSPESIEKMKATKAAKRAAYLAHLST